MRNKTKIFIGVSLLILGILIFLNNTGLLLDYKLSFAILWDYFWPILFMGIGITLLFDKNFTPGTIFLILSIALLATRILSFNFWSTFWPLIIIFAGVSILLRRDKPVSVNNAAKISDEDRLDDTVLFWGVEKKMTSKNFKGGDVNTVFGGYQLDLRDVKVSEKGAELKINCAFGGVEIFVPKKCRVVTNGTGILGGWTPDLRSNDVEKPVFTISGVVAFGAVDIKE
jgi:predicted membrane protein